MTPLDINDIQNIIDGKTSTDKIILLNTQHYDLHNDNNKLTSDVIQYAFDILNFIEISTHSDSKSIRRKSLISR
jgi:hypothetical protein